MFGKKLFTVTVYLVFVSSAVFANKSVFIISKHSTPSSAQAYAIDGNTVVYQDEIDIGTYNPGEGAVGNAVWPVKELMFITYEGSPKIVWSSTITLDKVGEIDSDYHNLAGIAVDEGNEKIYVAKRGGDDFCVYSFDDVNNTLVLDEHIELSVPSGSLYAWGIALDETNGLLYISTSTKTVHAYDTSDWSHDHSIDIVADGNDRPAVGIAIDYSRGYLYTGHWTSHDYLVKTSTTSPYTSTEIEITEGSSSKEILGVDVDEDTGYVYCTTYHNDFRVYDSNLILLDIETNSGISGPGGVAVGGWYKANWFSLVKDNNDPNNECVQPWNMFDENYLVFDICWDSNSQTDTNVVLIDYLPKEMDYYSSIPDGNYNDVNHTVTWNIGSVNGIDANCIELKIKVNEWARPGGSFTNLVLMEGDLYRNEVTCDVNICAWGGEIIYVDEDANGYNNGTSWDDAYNLLQDGFIGAQNCGAAVTNIWVAAGTYKPVYDTNDSSYKDESFNLVEDVGVFGHFGGVGTYETGISQRDFSDSNNTTTLEGQIGQNSSDAVKYIVKTVDIDDGLIDGFTIRGSYGSDGAGIFFDSSDISVVNCKLKENDDYGIYVTEYSYPDIHNCLFVDNTNSGVYSRTSQPDISYCTFDGNSTTLRGLCLKSLSVTNVSNSIFKDHTEEGIYGSEATLTVTNSDFENNSDNGIELNDDVTTTLENCLISNSGNNGIYADDSDLTMDYCLIDYSNNYGLSMESGCNLNLTGNVIRLNGRHGVYLKQNSATTIKNNWIHNNGLDEYSYLVYPDPFDPWTYYTVYVGAAIYFENQVGIPLIRNNTIYDNWTYGIESTEQGADPNVLNCIIYGNDTNDFYRVNDTFGTVNYCNLQNSHTGTGNITGTPGFKNVGTDPNDLHLDETSQCKDTGDPNGSYNESDIDGENRIYYGRVDIGADEYYWSSADFDEDGIVNFIDYAILATAWNTDSGDGNYDEDCDLEDNNSIDMDDLALFCEDWLWESAWDEGWMMCMGGGEGGFGLNGLKGGELMLLDVKTSLAARPERLTTKSEKFYAVNAFNTVSALQEVEQAKKESIKELDVKELLEWLDELWKNGDFEGLMTENQFQDFRDSIAE